MTAKVNDWVRFQRAGALVIGVVAHIREKDGYPWGREYVTDIGTVAERDVIDVRPAQAEPLTGVIPDARD